MTASLSILLLALMVAGALDGASGGEGPGRAWLVEFDELQQRLGDPKLRLIDVRPREAYETGHIPGAIWVDIKAVEKMAALPGGLTDRASWEAWIAPLGIGEGTAVLVCDGGRQLDAARLWWLLSYLGVEKVGLINGNVPLWAEQGRPMTREVPAVEPVARNVNFRADRHATRDEVRAAVEAGSARVVDARSEGEYTGDVKRSQRGGHVPAACHLEWNNLVGADGRFLDEPAARAKLEAIGVRPGEAVITHCQGGGRASVNAFVLERLGYRTRNYYLGWSDWGNQPDTPVEAGPKAAKP